MNWIPTPKKLSSPRQTIPDLAHEVETYVEKRSPKAIVILQEPLLFNVRVPMFTQAATKMPKVMNSW